MQAQHFSYSSLLRQRALVAAMALALVVVVIWVSLALFLTSKRNTISSAVKKLIDPLNPQLNLTVVERLELYQLVTLEEARAGVKNLLDQQSASASALLEEVAPPLIFVPVTEEGGPAVPSEQGPSPSPNQTAGEAQSPQGQP